MSEKKILDIVNEYIGDEKISIDMKDEDLQLLGMDSLAFIHIIVDIEESFGIEIPDEFLLLQDMNTLSKIIDIVNLQISI